MDTEDLFAELMKELDSSKALLKLVKMVNDRQPGYLASSAQFKSKDSTATVTIVVESGDEIAKKIHK